METFPIAPAATRALWLVPLLLAVILVPVVGLLGGTLVGAGAARFEVSPAGLRLHGDWYGRTIGERVAGPDAARVVTPGRPSSNDYTNGNGFTKNRISATSST